MSSCRSILHFWRPINSLANQFLSSHSSRNVGWICKKSNHWNDHQNILWLFIFFSFHSKKLSFHRPVGLERMYELYLPAIDPCCKGKDRHSRSKQDHLTLALSYLSLPSILKAQEMDNYSTSYHRNFYSLAHPEKSTPADLSTKRPSDQSTPDARCSILASAGIMLSIAWSMRSIDRRFVRCG